MNSFIIEKLPGGGFLVFKGDGFASGQLRVAVFASSTIEEAFDYIKGGMTKDPTSAASGI